MCVIALITANRGHDGRKDHRFDKPAGDVLHDDARLDPEKIDEDLISDHLYTRGLPDPDLMIRTSGEMRISNFLLWQIAYSEIHITPTLWPDFGREELLRILLDYQKRERRFGRVSS